MYDDGDTSSDDRYREQQMEVSESNTDENKTESQSVCSVHAGNPNQYVRQIDVIQFDVVR